MTQVRAPHLRRCWLFVPAAERDALAAASKTGADVLIQEFEDFCPPERRPEARQMAPEVLQAWRGAGLVAAVRINPLDGGPGQSEGLADLEAVMPGRPHVVALPKVAEPEHIVALDREISRLEAALGIPEGTTELLPNLEYARGLVQAQAIAAASPRVNAMLLASEDLVADLGAERGRDGAELAYARQRFLVECVAAGVVAVDCPYTFADTEGVKAETRWARRMGYKAKSAVAPDHAAVVTRVLTPTQEEIEQARRIVAIF
ncbi:MAG: CoA ester lyase, partial [Rhodovibrionaceae bacterium]|nr:CoA ester lyase [Rhodovibrionaceae bacterium]